MAKECFKRWQPKGSSKVMIAHANAILDERIALNMDQVEEYNPPPNPAKVTDSRFEKYEEEFGDESWELDALNPRIIHDLVTDKVLDYRDERKFAVQVEEERVRRKALADASSNWKQVAEFLAKFEADKQEVKERERRKRK